MDIEKTEIIDAFLRKELTGSELKAFESQLSGDPALLEEVNFQRQVVQGLADYRKAELVTRLNAIDIALPWWQTAQWLNPAFIKTASVALTATIIGTGIFYFADQSPATLPAEQPVVSVNDLLLAEKVLSNATLTEIELTNPKQMAYTRLEEDATSPALADAAMEEASLKEADASGSGVKEKENSGFVPDVSLPNPGDGVDEGQFKTESVEIPLASTTDIINTGQLEDIKTSQRNSEVIRYKYYDGKLHLYGNFRDTPYEVLEINRVNSKVVYLFHNNRYFKLLSTDKVIDLPQVTDRELIRELEIVRNNKVNTP